MKHNNITYNPKFMPMHNWDPNIVIIGVLTNTYNLCCCCCNMSGLAVSRGSVNCVVLLLWSTKYVRPVAVCLDSHPGGSGPRSSSRTLLKSLEIIAITYFCNDNLPKQEIVIWIRGNIWKLKAIVQLNFMVNFQAKHIFQVGVMLPS